MNKLQKATSRFYEKIIKLPNNGCWEWQGATLHTKWPYGQFWFNKKTMLAHHFSYIIHIGNIPDGLFVLHQCDNPRCVNPGHLFVGTQQDNIRDCVNKKRLFIPGFRGSKHPHSKLKEQQVIDIFHRSGLEPNAQLAKKYNTTRQNVSLIQKGTNWGWLTGGENNA